MSRFHWLWWVGIVGTLIVAGATALVLPGLPEQVPTHWNIKGQIDAYGPKSTLWLMPGVMLGMVGLFAIMPLISPKPFDLGEGSQAVLRQMMLTTAGMMAYIQMVVVLGASGTRLPIDRVLIAGLCLFLALIGNLMGKIKRNLYMGIRTPWTIANDRVWADTHRLGAWLFVGGGLLGVLIASVLPPILAVLPIFAAAIVPVVYSYVLYKRLERRGEIE